MIKPNELRIGNLFEVTSYKGISVRMPNGIVCKAITLGFPSLQWIEHTLNPAQEDSWAQASYHEIEPIPLDESWLLRFGFQKSTEVTCSFGYEKQYSVYRKGNFTYNGVQAAWWFDGKLLHKQPEYVHSLQNLIFALTGEEPELKA